MKFNHSILATAVIASLACPTALFAATPASLSARVFGGGTSSAEFAGGITISRGANFLSEIPSDQRFDVMAMLQPEAADVGSEGDLYMVARAGNFWYMRTPTGVQVWDGTVANLVPYTTKILAASETMVLQSIQALQFAGASLSVYVGYLNNAGELVHSSPMTFSVAPVPSSTCPAGTSQQAPITSGGKSLCVLSGTYTSDLHLTANFDYVISGPVFIGEDNSSSATLTIDAGVKTYGQSGADFLRISRGSKIAANGSPAAPITLTAAIDDTADENTTGAWGGLVLNGNAPLNGCTEGTTLCEAEGEGNSGTYGGTNATESSGNLNFLVIKYAGFEISPGNELNGLTLNAIGSGTLIDYVQVHNGSDDGFETFGGTVNAKHLVLTGNDDDSVDWQKGWTGKAQHIVVTQRAVGDRGIEADNNSSARDSLPRSKPQIANLTIVGNDNTGHGIKLRDGTAGNLFNVVVTGSGAGCVDIDHGPTFANAGSSATSLTGQLTIVNSLFDCNPTFTDAAEDNWSTQTWFTNQAGNIASDSGMSSYINSATVNARAAADLSGDAFFDNVDYIGAVESAEADWTLGWTFRPPLDALGQ